MSKQKPVLVEYAERQFIDINEIKEVRTFYPVCPSEFLAEDQKGKTKIILNDTQIKRLKNDLLSVIVDLVIITQKNRLIQHSYFDSQTTELIKFIKELREHRSAIKAPSNTDEYLKKSASFNKKIYVVEESKGNEKNKLKITYTEINITTDLSGTIKAVCKKTNIVSGIFSGIGNFITSLLSKDVDVEEIEESKD